MVRSLRKVGSVKRSAPFRSETSLPPGAAAQRVIVFLQEEGQTRICGVGMLGPAAQ